MNQKVFAVVIVTAISGVLSVSSRAETAGALDELKDLAGPDSTTPASPAPTPKAVEAKGDSKAPLSFEDTGKLFEEVPATKLSLDEAAGTWKIHPGPGSDFRTPMDEGKNGALISIVKDQPFEGEGIIWTMGVNSNSRMELGADKSIKGPFPLELDDRSIKFFMSGHEFDNGYKLDWRYFWCCRKVSQDRLLCRVERSGIIFYLSLDRVKDK